MPASKKKHKIIVYIFFALFLLIGISVFKDYSISWDEELSRDNGFIALKAIAKGEGDDRTLSGYINYGPAFEMVLAAAEICLNPQGDLRLAYLIRHLGIFLLFYLGVCFFYLLCKDRFLGWKTGLLGSLFLALSPRIFAHAFYNSRDIASLSFSVISVYTLLAFLKNKSLAAAVLHALACAFLVGIRVTGVFVIFLTVVFFALDILTARPDAGCVRKSIRVLSIYMISFCIFIVFFWPTLMLGLPLSFIKALKLMSHFPYFGTVLYLGAYRDFTKLPWHYIPVWIAISTPVAYTACFVAGCFISLSDFLKGPAGFYSRKKSDLIFFSWFFLPLLTVIVLKSTLYSDWRHMFFIYPAFIIIALLGLTGIFKFIKTRFRRGSRKVASAILAILIALNLLNVIKFMVQNHPYQNLYFNILAGKNMEQIKANFEFDYWELSSRAALEYILKNDPGKAIRVYVDAFPGKINANILKPQDRKRLIYVDSVDVTKYYLKICRGIGEHDIIGKEFHAIKTNGTKVMLIYKFCS